MTSTDTNPEPANALAIRVRTGQTDLNGSMYHGAYFDCFEAARVDVFRRLGYTYQRTRTEGFVPVIRRVECEYKQPAFMDDLITVTVQVPDMSAATITISYTADRDDERLAVGQAVFVFLDSSGKPIRVPKSLRECILANEATLGPRTPTSSLRSRAQDRASSPSVPKPED